MERVKEFLSKELNCLIKINFEKIYVRYWMNTTEIWITIKDGDYLDVYLEDYKYLVKGLRSIGVEASVTPIRKWVFKGSETYGWEELDLN